MCGNSLCIWRTSTPLHSTIRCDGCKSPSHIRQCLRITGPKSCHTLNIIIYGRSATVNLQNFTVTLWFHLPRTPALNFPKKKNNPNPSPIGNKFGLFLFGPSGENRTHGLLNPIQARYQTALHPDTLAFLQVPYYYRLNYLKCKVFLSKKQKNFLIKFQGIYNRIIWQKNRNIVIYSK